jgi:hypothetical protein
VQLGCLVLRLVLFGGGRADRSVAADGSAKRTGAATASWSAVLVGGEQGDEPVGCFGQVVKCCAAFVCGGERGLADDSGVGVGVHAESGQVAAIRVGVVGAVPSGLAPGIKAGLIAVRCLDPKGGMEFGAGAPLFDRFAYDPDTILAVLGRVIPSV